MTGPLSGETDGPPGLNEHDCVVAAKTSAIAASTASAPSMSRMLNEERAGLRGGGGSRRPESELTSTMVPVIVVSVPLPTAQAGDLRGSNPSPPTGDRRADAGLHRSPARYPGGADPTWRR
ncbi:hypothetical protein PA7_23700 [Pseudonocardia asaccharolytica DSM 44247 = NBRC 16224]|uniref:Uncharacterized protein n=1 Tax=Pseudonocardia asaccharolytica DSM 44247 = NBRC 16224 TaxID=1123024 RepID=A0A511D1X7_9PSEU|nr:hypothetical protein PA7_23700 [Pseudonocardia asaccharolytica DSM 44247 = NBRC 16224]